MSKSKTSDANKSEGRPWLLVGSAIVAGSYVAAVLIRDVLSWEGLSYSIGLGDGTGLMAPKLTAFLTWVLFVECCALSGVIGNYVAGRSQGRWFVRLFWGHVTFAAWVVKGVAWLVAALWSGVMQLKDRLRTVIAVHRVAATEEDEYPYATTG